MFDKILTSPISKLFTNLSTLVFERETVKEYIYLFLCGGRCFIQ